MAPFAMPSAQLRKCKTMPTPHIDSLDHATLSHLVAWLDWSIGDDTEDRLQAQADIERGLAYDPTCIQRNYSWGEIRDMGRE